MYTVLDVLMQTVIMNPALNQFALLEPKGPPVYNPVTKQLEPGPGLTGDALTRANEQWLQFLKKIRWLGNEDLARKYGLDPTPVLTAYENEQWERQKGLLRYWVSTIVTLVPEMGIPPFAKQGNESSFHAFNNGGEEGKPEGKHEPSPEALAYAASLEQMLSSMTPEKREETLRLLGLSKVRT